MTDQVDAFFDNLVTDQVTKLAPAFDGLDYVRNSEWKPVKNTKAGWQRYADKHAAKMKPKGFWHGVIVWSEYRNAYIVNYVGECLAGLGGQNDSQETFF